MDIEIVFGLVHKIVGGDTEGTCLPLLGAVHAVEQ